MNFERLEITKIHIWNRYFQFHHKYSIYRYIGFQTYYSYEELQ